jgi:tRNA A37 methylthiotransferase MiaB
MKRGHTVNTTKDLVKRLKDKIPEITIATDIITGFPTETNEDFEQTLDLISFIDPDIVNSSKFSSRPGTAASKLKKVDDDIISERSERLHYLIKAISKKRNSRWIGWEGEILINEIENGKLKGRNDYYKSIILDREPDDSFLNMKLQKYNQSNIQQSKFYPSYKDQEAENKVIEASPYKNSKSYFDNPLLGKRIRVRVVAFSNHVLNAIPI